MGAPWRMPDVDLLECVEQPICDVSNQSWQRVDFTIDSGAATSCIPDWMVKSEAIEPISAGPSFYTSASNNQIKVLGRIRPVTAFQNNVEGPIELTVLQGLKKPLISVAKLHAAGYEVHLSKGLSYMVHPKSQSYFMIYERCGVFVIPTWVSTRCLNPNGGQGNRL